MLGAFLVAAVTGYGATEGGGIRPPSVPLVAHDPYFSVWSPADRLTDAPTVHWTGRSQPLNSLIRIDGATYRLMGVEPSTVPALPQKSVRVLPTRTVYRFEGEQVAVTLTFLTPALPSRLEVAARPVTYVEWEVASADGKKHQVQLYLDCGGQVAVNTVDQAVRWSRPTVRGLQTACVGTVEQPVLDKRGDDLRIDWGHAYLAAPAGSVGCGVGTETRAAFADGGAVNAPEALEARPDAGVLAYAEDLGQVGKKAVRRHAMLAYDDEASILYFGEKLRPYWKRKGMDTQEMLQAAEEQLPELSRLSEDFDKKLLADLEKAGGKRYAEVCSLAYRQTFAGNKIVTDGKGKPLMFPKENFSNGCIGTVDVLFPQAPFFLLFSPELTKAMLQPVLDYSKSPEWPYGYAPHDLGTYPHATGQVYGMGGSDGDRMPVEECGNMLIMLAALARVEGNAGYSEPYIPTLRKWADYLVKEGLDPANQLCSADMFGHLPLASNLALKAVIGIESFGLICERLGKADDARRYRAIAKDYAAKWMEKSGANEVPRLAYDKPGTWGMMHNLVWDRIVGGNLFDRSLSERLTAQYSKVLKPYGLPVDSRTETSLIDWAVWSIAVARDRATFERLFDPTYRYVNETPSRVPLCDFFSTTDAKQAGFQARSVVGGIYVMPLLNGSILKRRTAEAEVVAGGWAAFPK